MYVVVVYWIIGSSMHQGEALWTLILTGHPGRKRWSARDSLHDPLNQTDQTSDCTASRVGDQQTLLFFL